MIRSKIILGLILIIFSIVAYFLLNKESKNHQNANLIPRQILFGNPDKVKVMLSPDGEYISYIAPLDGVLNIWVAPRKNIENAKPITNDKKRGIRRCLWSFDNEHIIYAIDNDGDENFRIYSKNINTGSEILLTPEKAVRAEVMQLSYKFPNEIIIGTNERDNKYFDVYKYNINTGNRELLLENNKFDNIIVDEDFQIRFASLINELGNTEYFKFNGNNWQPFIQVSLEDADNTGILGFDKSGNILYMQDSRGRNTAALKAINLNTGESNIIAEDNKSDVGIFTTHPTENTIQAVATYYQKLNYTVIDSVIKTDMDYLEGLSEGGEIGISGRSLDDKYWSIEISNDDSPTKYYIYDRNNHKAEYLFSNSKSLEQYTLAKMHPIIIKSRDGLDLVSYITFPKDVKLNKALQPENPLPMVLNVHGGPWARDTWGFSPASQWLADRGYVVLNINYRGSSGFGKDFSNAGNMQWGKKMHDDLIDGVNWAIANKIADPKGIVIMGGSYGGYAALAGITLTPEVFAGAVDIVGPSNLVTLLSNFPAYWTPIMNVMKKKIGPWDTDEEKQALLQVSPITFVDKITKPLLIGQGANDPRVTQLESDQIVESMNKRNIPVVYALYSDEGHGFARPENRISFYALTEQFLAKIIGGKAESIGNDLKDASLILNGLVPKDSAEAEKAISQAVSK
ncbi:MAG: S9 family peptidase [Rickettsiales bacterium]